MKVSITFYKIMHLSSLVSNLNQREVVLLVENLDTSWECEKSQTQQKLEEETSLFSAAQVVEHANSDEIWHDQGRKTVYYNK